MAGSEDSDATVASESNLSEGEEEGGRSPSVLRLRAMAGGTPSMEEVPCSSEDEMSEEYPPPNTSWPVSTRHLSPATALPGLKCVHSCRQLQSQWMDCGSAGERVKSGCLASGSRPMEAATEKQPTSNARVPAMETAQGNGKRVTKEVTTGRLAPNDVPSSTLSLEEVSRLQSALVTELEGLQTTQGDAESRPPGAAIDTDKLRRLQGKAAEVEGHLKAVSLANQAKRRRLAAAHTALSSGTSHAGTSQAIKDQLLGLASRQKQLLQLFVRQKVVAGKLSELQREHTASQSTTIPPNLTAANGTSISDRARSLGAPLNDTQSNATQCLPMETQLTSHLLLNSTASSTTSLPVPPLSHPEPQPARLPADLAQPVPLDVLIQHHFIVPEKGSLSCALMGCAFRATLLSDGCLEEGGRRFPQPHHWLTACWAALGHQKKVTRKQAYKMVFYKDVPLLQYCQKYSLKQVSSYLHQKQDTVKSDQNHRKEADRPIEAGPVSTHTVPPHCQGSLSTVAVPRSSQRCLISDILTKGRILLICKPAGAKLPEGFWEEDGDNWAPDVMQELYSDLDW